MPSLHLDNNHLKVVKEILKQHLKHCEVLAYGSRVAGNHHSASDLDLCIINQQNPQTATANIAAIRADLRASNLPITVDIVDFAKIPEHFQQEIMAYHIKIF